MKPKANPFLILSAACIAIGITAASAATWTGATNASWATSTNWTGTAPDNTTPQAIVYNTTSTANLNPQTLDASYTLTGITLTNPAAAVVVNNGTGTNLLTFGSGGIDLSAATQNLTLNVTTTVDAAQNWTVASGRTLTTGAGGSTLALNNALTIDGAGIVFIGGTSGSTTLTGSANLNINNGRLAWGTQTGSGVAGYSGRFVLNSGGKLSINTSNTLPALTINGGTIGSFNGTARTDSSALTIGGDFTIGGSETSGTVGNISTGRVMFTGAVDLNAGTRTITLFNSSCFGGFSTGTVTNGNLIKSGAGSLVLGTSVNMSAVGLDIQAGTVKLADGAVSTGSLSGVAGTSIDSNYNLVSDNARTLTVNQTVNGEYLGTITNAGGTARVISLIKDGAATLTLSGANTYTGTTTINTGTLKIGGAGTLGSGSYAGAITNNATLHFDSTAAQTLSGLISGSGALLKSNTSTLTISNTGNTYNGAVTVNAGTLLLSGALGSSSTLAVGGGTFSYGGAAAQTVNGLTVNAGSSVVTNTNSGDTNKLNLGTITRNAGGGTVNFSSASAANNVITTNISNTNGILGPWATVGADWAANDGSGNIVAYTGYSDVPRLTPGSIADGATANIRIVEGSGDPGNITLGAADTTINTLLQSAVDGTGAATIDAATGTLRTGGVRVAATAGALTIGTAADSGALTAASAGGELIVRNDSTNGLTVNSTIANNASASSLTILGNSANNITVTLTGNNTYSGGTTLLGDGWIRIGHNNALGTGAVTFNNSGVIRFGSDSATGRTLANDITFSGGGTIRFGAGSPANGTINLSGPISLAGGNRTIDTAVNVTFSGNVSNGGATPGGITKQGTSTLILSGANNTFSGLLNITTSGTVGLESLGAVNGAPSVNLTNGSLGIGAPFVGNTATIGNLTGTAGTITTLWNAGNGVRTLQVNQTTDGAFAGNIQSEAANLRSLALIKTGAATLTLTGTNNTYSGGTTVSGGTLRIGGAGTLGASSSYGGAISNSATLHFDSTATQTLSGQISGSGTLLKSNTGTLILTANSAYTGAITISAGTLQVGNNTTAGFIGNSATVTNNAALVWNRSNETNVGNNIAGTGTLTQQGPGTLNLNGASTYTGATTVSAGTLGVNGSLGNTAVTVQNGATLATNGNIGGSVTIQAGATHRLAVASTPGAQVTRTIGGTLDLTADGDILTLTAAVPPAAGTYILATASGGISGTPETVNQTGVSGTFSIDGNNLKLVVGGNDYDTWAGPSGYNLTQGPTGDDDGDGVANFEEYAFGLNPTSASSVSPVTAPDKTAGTFTYTRRKQSLTNLTYTYESSTNLGGWNPFTPPSPDATNSGDPVETITVTLPAALLAEPKLFLRIKAVEPTP